MQAGRLHEVERYGPFRFLNHTQRRYNLPTIREDLRKKENNDQALEQGQVDGPKTDGIRAGGVERLFRTRDNRKGSLVD